MDTNTLKATRHLAGQPSGWQDLALCAEVDPELFFPEKGESSRSAKRVCGDCEVRAECLQYALDHGERFGVWGGLSERERRELARQPKPARSCPAHGAAMSGGPALYHCPTGHCITAANLEKAAGVAAQGQVAA